jgi:hypothetical protein
MSDSGSGSPDHGPSDLQHLSGHAVEPVKGPNLFRTVVAIALGSCLGSCLIGCVYLAVRTWPSWGPAIIANLRYRGADFASRIAKKQTVPLGFEQTWDQPRFYVLGYGAVQWLAPYFGNGPAGCLMSEALGSAAPADDAGRHFSQITKDCPNYARALFENANIQFFRCISRGGVSECRQTVESYGIAIRKLKGEPNDETLYWIAVTNRTAILWERPETRLSPDDLDNTAVDLDDVLRKLAKTSGQDQLKHFAAQLRKGLTTAKITEIEQGLTTSAITPSDVKKRDPGQHDTRRPRQRHVGAHQDRRGETKKGPRSSWRRCHFARNSKGETFRVDKCR